MDHKFTERKFNNSLLKDVQDIQCTVLITLQYTQCQEAHILTQCVVNTMLGRGSDIHLAILKIKCIIYTYTLLSTAKYK